MQQLTKEQAIAFAENKLYENMSHETIAKLQMFQDCLCMPFGVFHEAVEKALGRSVWTHEFGLNRQGLMDELNGTGCAPTMQDIMNLIPEEKRVLITL